MKYCSLWFAVSAFYLAGCTALDANHRQTVAEGVSIDHAIASDLRCPSNPTISNVAAMLHFSEETFQGILKRRLVTVAEFCDATFDRKMNHITKGQALISDNGFGGPDTDFRLNRMHGGDAAGFAERYAEMAKRVFSIRETGRTGEQPISPGGSSSPAWESIGPGSVGGRIRSILVDPTNPNIVWLGAVTGGVWKSIDAGLTWKPTTDALGFVGIRSMTMMPGDPNTIFATTGEFYGSVGIIVTRNGGASWQLLPTSGLAATGLLQARKIVIHPTQPNQMVVAAGRTGIWRSIDSGATWTKTFDVALVPIPGGGYYSSEANQVQIDPNSPNNLIAGTSFGGILTSSDFGATWQTVPQFPGNTLTGKGRIELAYAKSVSKRIYASAGVGSTDTNHFLEVFRSDDGGNTWISLGRAASAGLDPTTWRDQSSYDNVIWVDPTSSNHILVGDIEMWRSLDGGVTWTNVLDWATRPVSVFNSPYPVSAFPNGGLNESFHLDHHVIVEDPGYNGSTNRRIWFGNDGGIWRADDISLVRSRPVNNNISDYTTRVGAFTTLNTDLRITQHYSINGSASLGGYLLSGLQDNGTRYFSGDSVNWWSALGGDGFRAAINPTNPQQFIATYQLGAIARIRTDSPGAKQLLWTSFPDGSNPFATYVESTMQAPNRLYMMNTGLWVSDDIWSAVPTRTRILDADPVAPQNDIASTAVAPSNPNTVWVIRRRNGVLHKSTNALAPAPIWQRLVLPELNYSTGTRLFIDPNDENRVYATFSAYQGKAVFRTTDGGGTWVDITNNLTSTYVYSITQHPLNNRVIYVGTEFGLYTSEDDGATWSLAPNGPSGAAIEDLQWFDNHTLLVATYGRGVYRVTDPSTAAPPGQSQSITFVNPGNQSLIPGIFSPVAYATSGLQVALRSGTPDICKTSGGIVKLAFPGTCTIYAYQPGNANYLSAPEVSQSFTITAPPIPSLVKRGGIDIDGSGRNVMLLRNTNGQMVIGKLDTNQSMSYLPFNGPAANFRFVAATDLDGDGKSDLVFQDMSQGEFGDVRIWPAFQSSNERLWRSVKKVWDVQAVGDLDGDGKSDLVWRYMAPDPRDTGVSYVWFYNDANTPVVRKRGGAPLDWKLLGAADLNYDGAADMVYISPAGQIRALMATSNPTRSCANLLVGDVPPGFTVLKLGDFTGARRGDILMWNPSIGKVIVMALNANGIPLPPSTASPTDPNASCTGTSLKVETTILSGRDVPPSWSFYTAIDLDGDGILDPIWGTPEGALYAFPSAGDKNSYYFLGQIPSGYTLVQP